MPSQPTDQCCSEVGVWSAKKDAHVERVEGLEVEIWTVLTSTVSRQSAWISRVDLRVLNGAHREPQDSCAPRPTCDTRLFLHILTIFDICMRQKELSSGTRAQRNYGLVASGCCPQPNVASLCGAA